MLARSLRRLVPMAAAAALLLGLTAPPALAAGTGTLSGTVTGPDGAPVAGACVRARAIGYAATVSSATSASDGSYRLLDVPTGHVHVIADPCAATADVAPQWYRGALRYDDALAVAVPDGGEVAAVDLALVAGGTIAGTVRDPNGAPVAGACVTTNAADESNMHAFDEATTRTDSDGRYRIDRLPQLPYRIRADGCSVTYPVVFAPGTADAAAARQVIPAPGGVVDGVDVQLQRPASLSGRVLENDGAALSGQCVSLLSSGFPRTSTTTGADGSWRIEGIGPGTYGLRVTDCVQGLHLTRWYDGAAWVAADATFALENGADRAVGDLVPPPAGAVGGTVLDDIGTAIGDSCAAAHVEGQDPRFGFTAFPGAVRIDSADGYLVGGLPAGRYVVSVSTCRAGSYGSVWVGGDDRPSTATPVEVVTGAVTGADMVLPRAAYVTGTVRDDLGQPARACVTFGGFIATMSAADGTYASPPLYPRDRTVGFASSCTSPPPGEEYPVESSTTVALAPAETRAGVDGVVATGLSLSGRVLNPQGDAVSRACVTATAPGQQDRTALSDVAGAWRLDGMAPAAWTIEFRICSQSGPNLMPTYYPGVPALADAVPVPLGAAAVTGLDTTMLVGARVTGVLTGPDGAPYASACVSASQPVTRAMIPSTGGETDADGRYDLRALPPGSYVMRANDCRHGPDLEGEPSVTYWPGTTSRHADAEPVTLTAGENAPASFRLLPGGVVRGSVTDTAGRPLVACVYLSSSEPWNQSDATDLEGRYVLPGLGSADDVRIAFTDCGKGTYASVTVGPLTTATARVQEQPVVALPVAATIAGVVRRDVTGEVVPGVCAVTHGADGTHHFARTGADGSYLLRALAPGSYVIRFTDCSGDAFVVDEYWRDAAAHDLATPITLVEGEDRTGIDAELLTVTLPGVPRDARTTLSPAGVASVNWQPPLDDGHAEVTSYVIRDGATEAVLGTVDGSARSFALTGSPAVTVEAVNRRGAGPRTSVVAPPAPPPPADVVPLPPARLLDTRDGTGGIPGRLVAGRPVDLRVTGRGGVPAVGEVAAVWLNTTATGAAGAGHLTVFPGGQRAPLASSLNYTAGRTVANLVLVPVGPDGTVRLLASGGSPHVVADVVGWVRAGGAGALVPLRPARVLDTRHGTGGLSGRLAPGSAVSLRVPGAGGVPSTGVRAVLLNTTVTGSTGAGHLTVFPGDRAAPRTSNLNHARGQTVAGLVLVPVAADGTIRLLSSSGSPHVVADVVGYVTDSVETALSPLPPARVLDSREGIGGVSGRLPAGRPVALRVTGRGGVPSTGVGAVLLNTTAVGAAGGGYLVVYPGDAARPRASSLNYAAGQTVANLVLVPVAPDGTVQLLASGGDPHVVADVAGWVAR